MRFQPGHVQKQELQRTDLGLDSDLVVTDHVLEQDLSM